MARKTKQTTIPFCINDVKPILDIHRQHTVYLLSVSSYQQTSPLHTWHGNISSPRQTDVCSSLSSDTEIEREKNLTAKWRKCERELWKERLADVHVIYGVNGRLRFLCVLISRVSQSKSRQMPVNGNLKIKHAILALHNNSKAYTRAIRHRRHRREVFAVCDTHRRHELMCQSSYGAASRRSSLWNYFSLMKQ